MREETETFTVNFLVSCDIECTIDTLQDHIKMVEEKLKENPNVMEVEKQ